MKNIKRSIVFMLGLCASLFFINAAKANTYPLQNPQIVKKMTGDDLSIGIKIRFKFGHGEDCRGRGLCYIDISLSKAMAEPGGGIGTGSFEDGRFVVDFEKKSMDAATSKTQFADGTFILEEDFTISAEQAKSWGVDAYTIAAGTYAVRDLGSTLHVVF